jgi:hypothetical protein
LRGPSVPRRRSYSFEPARHAKEPDEIVAVIELPRHWKKERVKGGCPGVVLAQSFRRLCFCLNLILDLVSLIPLGEIANWPTMSWWLQLYRSAKYVLAYKEQTLEVIQVSPR